MGCIHIRSSAHHGIVCCAPPTFVSHERSSTCLAPRGNMLKQSQPNPTRPKLSAALPQKRRGSEANQRPQQKPTTIISSLFFLFPLPIPVHPLTSGGWGSIGSDFERSPAIMLVEDADDEATPVLKGSDGATNALAPAAKAKVAAISNFMVVYGLIRENRWGEVTRR